MGQLPTTEQTDCDGRSPRDETYRADTGQLATRSDRAGVT